MQMPMFPLEVRRPIESEPLRHQLIALCVEQSFDLLWRPHVVLAFDTFRIRIQGGVVAARGRLHFAHDPSSRLLRSCLEQRIACDLKHLGTQRKQWAVVVEHFLEVRNHPLVVYRVAAVAAADLVIQPALGHFFEREGRHLQCAFVRGSATRSHSVVPQEPFDVGAVGELGRTAEAAMSGLE